jgi:5-methylthioadenosine/S-adenosylhomocysteine deaminase
VAHCPASNAKLAHGIAPLIELLDAGARVGLGSDSVASNDRMDLLDEARLALLLQSARTGRANALSASNALELATLGGARALGIAHDVGSLEVGKAADLAAFPLGAGGRAPTHDPAAAAVLTLAGTPASFVAVAGRPLVRNSELIDADAGVHARVQSAAERLRAWADSDEGTRAIVTPTPTPGR